MQYQPLTGKPQLSLFEGLIAQQLSPFGPLPGAAQPDADYLSEMSVSGSDGHCRLLLAPILRELSEADGRWLTLIAPPAAVSPGWLRESGLNRERILLLQAGDAEAALELSCKALAAGCSHTVISWLGRLDKNKRRRLQTAASQGGTQSLNIRMGR
jgi:cell division inhibitor SulA